MLVFKLVSKVVMMK